MAHARSSGSQRTNRRSLTNTPSKDVTRLLRAWAAGDEQALNDLVPLVYGEIRGVAHAALRRERPGRPIQTTELVNEAYVRLVQQTRTRWQSRSHFFAIAAQVMRRILVDEARARKTDKRGAGVAPLSLDAMPLEPSQPPHDITDLDDALRRLTVLLRVFGGLTDEEISEVLKVSPRTVRRDWSSARAWLSRELSRSP